MNLRRAISRISMRAERFARLWLLRHSRDPRPSSAPFISGDSFRKLARHVFEDPADVAAGRAAERAQAIAPGDIVFVASPLLESFRIAIHPRIAGPYILITHNGDRNIAERDLDILADGKVSRWFAQNAACIHPRLTPLPIGLENAHHMNNGRPDIFKKLALRTLDEWRTAARHKAPKIIAAFSVETNPGVRDPIAHLLKGAPAADYFPAGISFARPPKARAAYLERAMFIASPPGNGLDCHRTWEAMYIGTVPIVARSPATKYFEGLGLPLWIVDDWSELARYDAARLEKKYLEIAASSSLEALWLDHWKEAMGRVQ